MSDYEIETDLIESFGAHSFTERLSDAKPCLCGGGMLWIESRGDSSMYGRAYRRVVCSCGRFGDWSTSPVAGGWGKK